MLSCTTQALLYRKFSSASDVWSFGVVMFEIYAFGKKPFFGMTPDKVSILSSFVLMIRCGVSVTCDSSILAVTLMSSPIPDIVQVH